MTPSIPVRIPWEGDARSPTSANHFVVGRVESKRDISRSRHEEPRGMSEQLPPATGAPATGEETYKPISGLALGGLILSGIFAGLVVFSTAVALVKGAPIFLPTWLLLTPIVGFILCLVGRNQILGSDDTRAGLKLAHWGVALALFSGLGYAAYFVTIGYAVAGQANEFVVGPAEPDNGFLKHLMRAGQNPEDFDIAFLLTRPANARVKLRPGDRDIIPNTYDQPIQDAGAGEVSRFRSRIMVQMLMRAGDKTELQPLGVHSWSHERGSYKVVRSYRIRTPEAELDVLLQVESTEAEVEGQLRQWFVNLLQSPLQAKRLTPLGKVVEESREQAFAFIENKWRPAQAAGEPFADFAKIDKTDWKRAYPDSERKGDPKGTKVAQRELYQRQAQATFAGKVKQFFSVLYDNGGWPMWGLDDAGHFWVDVPVRMLIEGNNEFPSAWAEGTLRVRTREPFDPAKVSPPAPILDWEVVEVNFLRVRQTKSF
jgi:hypothetical protein